MSCIVKLEALKPGAFLPCVDHYHVIAEDSDPNALIMTEVEVEKIKLLKSPVKVNPNDKKFKDWLEKIKEKYILIDIRLPMYLRFCQNLIPESWDKTKHILFTGMAVRYRPYGLERDRYPKDYGLLTYQRDQINETSLWKFSLAKFHLDAYLNDSNHFLIAVIEKSI